jgi:hypothetical protein
MQFTKGQSGNPTGRRKGSQNKVSAEQREFLSDFLLKNKAKFKKRLNALPDKDYVHAYTMLMHYVVPKPATTDLRYVPKLEEFILMTPEERKVVIDEIQEEQRNQNQ